MNRLDKCPVCKGNATFQIWDDFKSPLPNRKKVRIKCNGNIGRYSCIISTEWFVNIITDDQMDYAKNRLADNWNTRPTDICTKGGKQMIKYLKDYWSRCDDNTKAAAKALIAFIILYAITILAIAV